MKDASDPKAAVRPPNQHWTEVFHAVSLAAVPKLFEWLGWIAAISTLQYLGLKSMNWTVLAAWGISYLALLLYFNSFFINLAVQITGAPKHSALTLRAFLASLLMAIATSFIATQAIDALSAVNA